MADIPTSADRSSRIAELNDRCRQGLDSEARIVVTAACLAALAGAGGLDDELRAQAELLAAVRLYRFTPEDGADHRRGEVVVRGRIIRFVIDYYDRSLEWGSEDPADPDVTMRVMTILLPEDD
jgi:hypothetical protein